MHSFAQLCHLIFFVKICQTFAEFSKILAIFRKTCDLRTVQRSALCRSRRELSNAYFLAKIGLDTAENEPCQVCPTPRNAAAAPRALTTGTPKRPCLSAVPRTCTCRLRGHRSSRRCSTSRARASASRRSGGPLERLLESLSARIGFSYFASEILLIRVANI